MKRKILVAAALFLTAAAASATTLKWTAGWDNFSEPLNYKKSKVTFSVNATTKKLTVTYTLVSATPASCIRSIWLSSAPRLPAPSASSPSKASSAATIANRSLARESRLAQSMPRWASSQPT